MLISYVPRYKELEGCQKELKRHVLKKRDKPIVRVNVLLFNSQNLMISS